MSSRTFYAAAHVVAHPESGVDWDATLAFRRHLWDLGLGVADAMDTAQRGNGLDWATTAELIRRSGAEARAGGGLLACGAGTDQLPAGAHPVSAIEAAYREQVQVVQESGAKVILMASRALTASATGPEDYLKVYSQVLADAGQPVILHWLGDMFDPALHGYWGSTDLDRAADTVLELIHAHAPRIDGIKVSLLDASREIALRRVLPEGVRLYTGDDFHYPELIAGDEHGYSHALLGVFDAIAEPAARALAALDEGDVAGFRAVLDPTVPLARHIFAAPTYHYKTGIVFLAWLNGHQDHFRMVGGHETSRPIEHLTTLYRLAGECGVLRDPDLAAARFSEVTQS
ncbi:dihydrodipicolinate synthase family protein [Longispora albida]|uniref:dihydrodipicolinate synthase family protein n=1 Tax=Longispora albida TaxID=203523 RepID=UPI0003820D0A|nr:dihydrodipicolinate synthase family protein [Longispora albida]